MRVTAAREFRAQFPVLERLAYLNAGTEGPLPRRAADAVHARIDYEVSHGRCGRPYFEELIARAGELRARYAGLLGCEPEEIALTGSTTDGINTVLSGLDLRPGDEILTSDQEHPGLLAPLGRARQLRGVTVRVVPFAELAGEVTPGTRLVACSHVSWVNGQVCDVAALTAAGPPVLLDAAQAIGAISVDVNELGVDFYAASGQKWLCGPEGSGCLYVRQDRLEELVVPWPGFCVARRSRARTGIRAGRGRPAPRSRLPGRECAAIGRSPRSTPSRRRAGAWVHGRAASLAASLADRLAERGARGAAARALDARLVAGRRPRGRGGAARRSGTWCPQHPRSGG